MAKTAFAIACHPDDIEFMMAGTLFLLKRAGWDVHYMNLCDVRPVRVRGGLALPSASGICRHA